MKIFFILFNIIILTSFCFSVNYYFAGRKNPKIVVFKDKLYIIGGYLGYSGNSQIEVNDIWISNYGDTWDKLTKNFLNPSRINYSCTVHKGKIWIIGGFEQTNRKFLNDVWYTENVKDWNKLTDKTTFSERINASLISYKNKLWLIGGVSKNDTINSDIWNSENGYDWVKVSDNHFINSNYNCPIVVYKEKLYYFSYGKGIYSTEDGINWEEVNDDNKVISYRSFYSVEVFQDSLYVICGQLDSPTSNYKPLTNEVWRSSDAKEWKLISPEYDFIQKSEIYHRFSINPIRKNHSSSVFKDRIFIFGGETGDNNKTLSDIWNTIDGYKWVQIK